jgi:hypothetical protein
MNDETALRKLHDGNKTTQLKICEHLLIRSKAIEENHLEKQNWCWKEKKN